MVNQKIKLVEIENADYPLPKQVRNAFAWLAERTPKEPYKEYMTREAIDNHLRPAIEDGVTDEETGEEWTYRDLLEKFDLVEIFQAYNINVPKY